MIKCGEDRVDCEFYKKGMCYSAQEDCPPEEEQCPSCDLWVRPVNEEGKEWQLHEEKRCPECGCQL